APGSGGRAGRRRGQEAWVNHGAGRESLPRRKRPGAAGHSSGPAAAGAIIKEGDPAAVWGEKASALGGGCGPPPPRPCTVGCGDPLLGHVMLRGAHEGSQRTVSARAPGRERTGTLHLPRPRSPVASGWTPLPPPKEPCGTRVRICPLFFQGTRASFLFKQFSVMCLRRRLSGPRKKGRTRLAVGS